MAKQADLLSVEDARQRILARFAPLGEEAVPLDESRGRILATAITAGFDLPPFANSSMDGFAVRGAETVGASTAAPLRLRVSAHIPAGTVSAEVMQSGEAARIMTGAPLPSGADAVVPFEDVTDHGTSIMLRAPIRPGACVRPSGQDIAEGVAVLPKGTEIGSRGVAVLAALGYSQVPVRRRPIVGVMATGSELVAPGVPLQPGQIYNSNSPMLSAAVAEAGAVSRALRTASDDAEAISRELMAAGDCDLLLTSGGASVGDFDYMKDVVGATGDLHFWRVRVRPGKPLLFGTVGSTPIIALPGNPTSAMVTFELFVRPAIRLMLGASAPRPRIQAVVTERMENRGGRRTYARVVVRQNGDHFNASLSGPQDSAMVLPLARCDGLLEMSEDIEELLPGDSATVHLWRLPSADAGT